MALQRESSLLINKLSQLSPELYFTSGHYKGYLLGTDHIFSRGGYRDWEKNCLHEKNCWNKLSAPEVHLKKIVCRGHPCYGKFREFFKKLSAQWMEEKFVSAQSMVGKNFLPPGNHDAPPGGIMVCPLLNEVLYLCVWDLENWNAWRTFRSWRRISLPFIVIALLNW